MKKGKIGVPIAVAALCVSMLGQSASAINPYGIVYSGGEALGANNVNIDAGLSSLSSLTSNNSRVQAKVFPGGGAWKDAYAIAEGECHPFAYTEVWEDKAAISGLGWSIIGEKYTTEIEIGAISVNDAARLSSDAPTTVGVNLDNGWLLVGFSRVYTDSGCTNPVPENLTGLSLSQGNAIFVEANIKLYKEGSTDTLHIDPLYYAITDMDHGQSYKILNPGSQLSSENMYAISVEDLQDNSDQSSRPETFVYKNMFVSNGNYIYSQHGTEDGDVMGGQKANLFVKLDSATQEEGINVVYGFSRFAGSGIGEFYANHYLVNYISDEYGSIVGITDEKVVAGENPSGSSSEPDEGYEFAYWVADKDVTLEDGAIIKAGEKMTPEQVKQVVVNDDITFEAIHDTGVKSPDTGASTMKLDAEYIKVSLLLLSLVATAIAVTPKLIRKKVGFNKK